MNRLSLLACFLCIGCATVKPYTSTEVRVIERTEFKPITVFTDIPEIKETVSTKDTTSHLENEYASSDASIDREGNLTHTLATKPQKRPQVVDVPVVYKDSIVVTETTVEKEVPAELTWWQKFRLKAFWWLSAIVILILAIRVIKWFK